MSLKGKIPIDKVCWSCGIKIENGSIFKKEGKDFCSAECLIYFETSFSEFDRIKFDKFIFPMVRTIFPNLIAKDLVDVQPMENTDLFNEK